MIAIVAPTDGSEFIIQIENDVVVRRGRRGSEHLIDGEPSNVPRSADVEFGSNLDRSGRRG